MPMLNLTPDGGLVRNLPAHRLRLSEIQNMKNLVPTPAGVFRRRWGSVHIEPGLGIAYTSVANLEDQVVMFADDTWYRTGTSGGGAIEDFESGVLTGYDAYEDVGLGGADKWVLVTTKVPEGIYALVCIGQPATVHSLLHTSGVTPRGYEYRFTVRRVSDDSRNDLVFLFAVQNVLYCYGLHVDLYYGYITGGQYENTLGFNVHGDPQGATFPLDTDVEVFVRWDSGGLLTYGSAAGTKTYQTTLGYTTGTWGWRYLDTAPDASDCPRRDYLRRINLS